MGTSCSKLKATPKNVSLTGKDQANIADYVSVKNIPSFGKCRSLGYPPTASATAANHGKLTPMPCVPGTCPKWKAIDKDSLICGEPALLRPATLKCSYGGTISIIDPGQYKEIKAVTCTLKSANGNQQKIEDQIKILSDLEDAPDDGKQLADISQDDFLNGLQDFLGVVGLVPVAGAAADLINAGISVARGDWTGAGLNLMSAVPGIGDITMGAKIAYRVTKIKSTGKLVKNTYKAAKRIEKKDGINRKNYNLAVDTMQNHHEFINDGKIE